MVGATRTANAAARRVRRFDWPALFGYDFFISFKLGSFEQGGAQSYASYVARALRELDHEVFFSEDEAPPGSALDATLVTALHRSRVLVIVANESALRSHWVQLEVAHFRRDHPRRPIVAIDVDHAVERAAAQPQGPWLCLGDRIRLDENESALRDGLASDALIRRLALTATSLGARRRLRLALGGTLLLLAGLAAYAGYSALDARRQAVLAEQRMREAEHEREVALARLRDATGRRLAAQSLEMLSASRPGGDERALLQLLAAYRLAPVGEVAAALQRALQVRERLLKLWPAGTPIARLAFSPADTDHLAVVGGEPWLRMLDARRGSVIGAVRVQVPLDELVFSPDGQYLVTGDRAGHLQRWDAGRIEPQGAPVHAHAEGISALAISPDGRMLASASADGQVRLWDAIRLEPRDAVLPASGAAVERLAFSLDGSLLAIAGRTGLRLWDLRRGRAAPWPRDTTQEGVYGLAFAPDGQRLAAGGMRSLRLLSLPTGRLIGRLGAEGYADVGDLAINRAGLLASAHIDGRLLLWDEPQGRQVRPPRGQSVADPPSLAFSADGRRIALGARHGGLDLWAVGVDQPARAGVDALAFLPDGEHVLTGADGRMVVRHARGGEVEGAPLVGHRAPLRSIAVDSRGERAATAANDATLRLWDLHARQPLGAPLRGHVGWVTGVAMSPDGRWLVSSSNDGTLRRWDAVRGEAIGAPMQAGGEPVLCVAISPDGRRIASGHADGALRLWDAATGAPSASVPQAHEAEIAAVAFSPDGRQLASAGMDGRLRRWEAADLQPLGDPMRGHGASLKGVAYSPDSRFIASNGDDGQLRLWDAATGDPFGAPIEGGWSYASNIAFRADGRAVLAGGQRGGWRVLPVLEGWADALCDKLTREPTAAEWLDWVGPGVGQAPLCPRLRP